MPLNVHRQILRLHRFSGVRELVCSSAHFGFRREKRNETTTGYSAGGTVHDLCFRTISFERTEGHEGRHLGSTAADHATAAADTDSRSGDPALQQQVSQAQAAAQAAQQTANAAVPQAEALDKQYFDPLQHDVADLKTVSGNTVNELQETQKRVAGLESPLAIHYKGITITPGGFLAAETVWRQRAEGRRHQYQFELDSVSRRFAGAHV